MRLKLSYIFSDVKVCLSRACGTAVACSKQTGDVMWAVGSDLLRESVTFYEAGWDESTVRGSFFYVSEQRSCEAGYIILSTYFVHSYHATGI